ncbi:tachykinin-like peptides receptor 86C isoform X1 [Aphis craccivora]|uniref:Tachykinin-like peptides receptor 86C isoform X1 n=1 Tax=Aphis craccivora TaxID=307492 RepID=A0A6G0Z0G2_APHCR|nr:tachykinin-like peptides receptor 86C isoform X1 [Aphis craccivora]
MVLAFLEVLKSRHFECIKIIKKKTFLAILSLKPFFIRYMAIVHPLRHRRSKTRTQTVLILIWLISFIIYTFEFQNTLYNTNRTIATNLRIKLNKIYMNGELRRACYILWPDGRYPDSKTEYIYNNKTELNG